MKERAPRNRTITLTEDERLQLLSELLLIDNNVSVETITNQIINGDILSVIDFLPSQFVDLLILDPPYNLSKNFHGQKFGKMTNDEYLLYLESWFPKILKTLKPHATVYLCGDWKCSIAEYMIMDKYLHVQNRIIWQREKGRGALTNWKNCCEDIWFATVDNEYYFDVESVKMKRKVIAPYKENGKPKDWEETDDGNFRITYPSNFWDDISIPYWSMPENTDHPTQKPEKLIAKLILASSKPGDFVLDPFLGSGTTAVVAQKLNRQYCGIEINKEYCCWAKKRLNRALTDINIQGYSGGVFWERNSFAQQKKSDVLEKDCGHLDTAELERITGRQAAVCQGK